MKPGIHNPLTLNADRSLRDGSFDALNAAIRRGADLRIATAFRHNEHIDPAADSAELVEEVAEFRETYLLEDRWSAAFMTLRLPVEIPVGFGPRPSMSFFMYNQDGSRRLPALTLMGHQSRASQVRQRWPITAPCPAITSRTVGTLRPTRQAATLSMTLTATASW